MINNVESFFFFFKSANITPLISLLFMLVSPCSTRLVSAVAQECFSENQIGWGEGDCIYLSARTGAC